MAQPDSVEYIVALQSDNFISVWSPCKLIFDTARRVIYLSNSSAPEQLCHCRMEIRERQTWLSVPKRLIKEDHDSEGAMLTVCFSELVETRVEHSAHKKTHNLPQEEEEPSTREVPCRTYRLFMDEEMLECFHAKPKTKRFSYGALTERTHPVFTIPVFFLFAYSIIQPPLVILSFRLLLSTKNNNENS